MRGSRKNKSKASSTGKQNTHNSCTQQTDLTQTTDQRNQQHWQKAANMQKAKQQKHYNAAVKQTKQV
jgi:hypothetical protein